MWKCVYCVRFTHTHTHTHTHTPYPCTPHPSQWFLVHTNWCHPRRIRANHHSSCWLERPSHVIQFLTDTPDVSTRAEHIRYFDGRARGRWREFHNHASPCYTTYHIHVARGDESICRVFIVPASNWYHSLAFVPVLKRNICGSPSMKSSSQSWLHPRVWRTTLCTCVLLNFSWGSKWCVLLT